MLSQIQKTAYVCDVTKLDSFGPVSHDNRGTDRPFWDGEALKNLDETGF